jgi:hypothetical protein
VPLPFRRRHRPVPGGSGTGLGGGLHKAPGALVVRAADAQRLPPFQTTNADAPHQYINAAAASQHTAALSKFQRGQVLTIIGVCAGKAGMVGTYYPPVFNDGTRDFFKSNPAIAFKDCVLVK